MDYEKAYKEALERAKGLIDFCSDSELKTLENVFPELRESEDEMIGKELIDFVKSRLAGFPQCEKFIAWLEKQGEKMSDPRYSILAKLIEADDIYQMSVNEAMVEDAKSKAVNALSKLEISKLLDLEKQAEQKPADKSDSNLSILNKENREVKPEDLIKKPSLITIGENEMILNEVISILDNGFMPSSWERARLANGLQSIKLQQNYDWSEEDEDKLVLIGKAIFSLVNDGITKNDATNLYNWLKSLKDRVQPQQKQKWSEEDEKLTNRIEGWLDTLCDYLKDSSPECIEDVKDIVEQLKSLRPQNRWKPSDEQITWLYRAADDASKDSRMKQILNELLSDLKKLKCE